MILCRIVVTVDLSLGKYPFLLWKGEDVTVQLGWEPDPNTVTVVEIIPSCDCCQESVVPCCFVCGSREAGRDVQLDIFPLEIVSDWFFLFLQLEPPSSVSVTPIYFATDARVRT